MADNRVGRIAHRIVDSPQLSEDFWQNRENVLAREIPSKWGPLGHALPRLDNETNYLRTEVAELVEQLLHARTPRRGEIQAMADVIVLQPNLRWEYFANPERAIARQIPETWYERLSQKLGLRPSGRTADLRCTLAKMLQRRISGDPRLISARETYYERESFLKEGMKNLERSFRAVFWMSIGTFVIGVLLLGGAVAAAIVFEDPAQKATMTGLSGGAGVVTMLVGVLRAASGEIRRIHATTAQMRMILTDFATEIGHLRGVQMLTFSDATRMNKEIRRLTRDCTSLIARNAMPADDDRRPQQSPPLGRTPQHRPGGEGRQGLLQRVLRRP